MKKALFIDRDGTLIQEPPHDFMIDSLEDLEFLPGVFRFLGEIARKTDYELVMVTNQDGLGTEIFPDHAFWPAHIKMLTALQNEGIVFSEIFIDRSFPEENLPTRKPGTGMLWKYMDGSYDLANSFVIGDRYTDVLLAKNLGAKGIYLHTDNRIAEEGLTDFCALQTMKWEEIYRFLMAKNRSAQKSRATKETDIYVSVNLDGKGKSDISTGLGFFDHMLEQIAKHSGMDLTIKVKGDLYIDEHHTVEDTAITLGEAVLQALGDKRGIERYGFSLLPMDDCLAQVALDFGGRPWLVWEAVFKREKVGEVPTELFSHFFKSFSDAARCNLNIKAEGQNEHHKIESVFKAFAKALKTAAKREPGNDVLPTTKGLL